jgi:hypothetical protein
LGVLGLVCGLFIVSFTVLARGTLYEAWGSLLLLTRKARSSVTGREIIERACGGDHVPLGITDQMLHRPRRLHSAFGEATSQRRFRADPADARRRNHIRQLEALGYKVTLEPAA